MGVVMMILCGPVWKPQSMSLMRQPGISRTRLLLQKVHFELRLILDQVITRGAIPPDLDGSAARRMPGCISGQRVTGPPLRE